MTCMAMFAASLLITLPAAGGTKHAVDLSVVDYPALLERKAEMRRGDPNTSSSYRRLIERADRALQQEIVTVVQKKTVPPSGDKRDYMSQAPYWWPDPQQADGLPYIRHDGKVNPEARGAYMDMEAKVRFFSAVNRLGLAAFFTDDVRYAQGAVAWLDAWFVDPETRMNPHLEYAQGIPGRNEGRCFGIIEWCGIDNLITPIQLLNAHDLMPESTYQGTVRWFEAYLEWLVTSEKGRMESSRLNNHATWYDVQVVGILLFLDRRSEARERLEEVKTERIATQIEPDGRQPHELARTKSLSYSKMNLSAFKRLAHLGEKVGVDLWDYETEDGRSIRKAQAFLAPYLSKQQPWPYQQLGMADNRAKTTREFGVTEKGSVTVTGELKTWHKVTLTFDGPTATETDAKNPFLDYRLSVTFHKGDKHIVVPGYFAADGAAANTSASRGTKWRVHFRPDETGRWQYSVSFRTGAGVALKLDADNTGSAGGSPLDGRQGTFIVRESDKVAPDLRAPDLGRVVYNGSHVLSYAGSGTLYVKAGEGSPENFLAYHEFDQTADAKDTGFDDGLVKGLHQYAPHKKDFVAGDPTWQGGKGKGILGVINYLAGQGLNSVYFLTFNIGPKEDIQRGEPRENQARACGDGGDTWPWIDPTERLRFDVSKLDQWDRVFTHMNDKGLGLTFMLAEAENEEALDDDATTAMGPERALYYREMVARFGHHLNIMWVPAEETGTYAAPGIVERNKVRMKRLRELDPYDHPLGLHNGKVKLEDYVGCPDMTYYSYQSHQEECHDIFPDILKLRQGNDRVPPRWVIMNDEQGRGYSGVGTNTENWDPGFVVTCREALWGTFMAGGTGVSWYHGGRYPQGDGDCEDFSQRSDLFRLTRYALGFLRENDIPLQTMRNQQDLLVDATDRRCLAQAGSVYIVQLTRGADSAALKLGSVPASSRFSVTWFDPLQGRTQASSVSSVRGGGIISIGTPPYATGRDWIALVQLE